MIHFAEILLVLGTILLVVTAFINNIMLGLIVLGVSFLIWGTILLIVLSKTTYLKKPSKDGGD